MTSPRSALAGTQFVIKAAHFAAVKHVRQKRKGAAAEPYLNHLIEVADLVANSLAEPDPDLVAAALLHDTVEDTGTTRAELQEAFGTDVADLVAEVTDDKSLPDAERKRRQVEHAPHLSVRAQRIKLADKISNLRGILDSPPQGWDQDRKRKYFLWGQQVVAGLTSPDPALLAEFHSVCRRFDEQFGN